MTGPRAPLAALRQVLRPLEGGILVCFSGGVDSGLVLAAAHELHGDRVVALTTTSASLAREERAAAEAFVRELGVEHVLIESCELEDPDYVSNPEDRCYYCKRELFDVAREVAQARGLTHILTGTNASDLRGHRPGHVAAGEAGARAPLVEAALEKRAVREAAKTLSLPLWDKPALACLASRIPYGTEVTATRLGQVESVEATLKALGFRVYRARHHDETVRIELGVDELPYLLDAGTREAVVTAGREAGFKHVAVDLSGYRQGAMNAVPDPVEPDALLD